LYFDKSADTNWFVAWHQDTTIAVSLRENVAGFGPWSEKDGIPHVRPPQEFLQQMLAVRINLDDADETNGALQVIPGSHRYGLLSAERIQELRAFQSPHVCVASAGDVLLMRPLLLHASKRSVSSRRRRVLHIEYAAFDLPSGLTWHEVA
jgi:ectoine hydroxylase-related dioxygenase (phytanoyl-CoA dioxygenase family)